MPKKVLYPLQMPISAFDSSLSRFGRNSGLPTHQARNYLNCGGVVGEKHGQLFGPHCTIADPLNHRFDRTATSAVNERHFTFSAIGPKIFHRNALVSKFRIKH